MPEEAAIRYALSRALRAPSAHNAQPWRLSREAPDRYLLWYAYADRLLADPDDRDGMLAMGGFFETIRLSAQQLGLEAVLEESWEPKADGLVLGTVAFDALRTSADPLAAAVGGRHCNRRHYQRTPLPPALTHGLQDLGNILLTPGAVAPLVTRASVLAWRDHRFVTDLREWTRFVEVAPDGMTVNCLLLNRIDQLGLRIALKLGSLPAPLARVFAERDVRLTKDSAALAVLSTESREPAALFECGRRLIRSWTLINSLGYAWHPMSIVIDQSTVADLRSLVDGRDAVAIYRVGHPDGDVPWSGRRDLDAVVTPTPR